MSNNDEPIKVAILRLDKLVKDFKQLLKDYPEAEKYDDILHQLQTQRAETASRIGRK